jgi:hypothetical protein
MCEAPCLEGGWEDIAPHLRPEAHGGALSQLTLCRRCTRSISSPPGMPLLDVIHACNSTFASRSRSYTFVAFLREYKLLLELIGIEDSDTFDQTSPVVVAGLSSHSKVDVMSPRMASASSLSVRSIERGVEILTQLLRCIESTLVEEVSLREAHREHQQLSLYQQHDVPRAQQALPRVIHVAQRRGAEWLLRPTERDLLETEAQHHRKLLLWLEKKQSLTNIEKERHHHHHHQDGGLSVHDRVGAYQQNVRDDPVDSMILSASQQPPSRSSRHHDAQQQQQHIRPLASVQSPRHHRRHQHNEERGGSLDEEMSDHRPSDVKDLLREYFSGELPTLPLEAFDQYLSSPSRRRNVPDTITAHPFVQHRLNHEHLNDRDSSHIDDNSAEGRRPAERPSSVESSALGQERDKLHEHLREEQQQHHHAAVLRKIEMEMTNVRKEHDRQRHAWGEERSGLLDELSALRAKVGELESASISEHRRHRRSASEQTSMVEGASRASQALLSWSARFGIWSQCALQHAVELQRVKSDLLAVEVSAVMRGVMLEAQSLARRIDTLESEKKDSARFEKLLAEARAEVTRSAVGAAAPLASSPTVSFVMQQEPHHLHQDGQLHHNTSGAAAKGRAPSRPTIDDEDGGVSYF